MDQDGLDRLALDLGVDVSTLDPARVGLLASDIELPVEAGDFKLLSRRVVDELIALGEQDLYMRGLVTWVGFEQVAVPYERQPRGVPLQLAPCRGQVAHDQP